jgi:acyl-CoA thioesterase-2
MIDRFSDLIAVEPLGDDRFVVRPPGNGFLFGGLSMAMMLRCAAETVGPGKTPMTLHTTFLTNGDWGGPHDIAVGRVSDTRAFSVRRIEMSTGGKLAIVAEAVFHTPETGEDWQARGMPAIPSAEALDRYQNDKLPGRYIEIRPVFATSDEVERIHPYWCRTVERLEAPIDLACALAFISDYWIYATPFPAGSGRSQGLLSRTLNHTLAFHRPPADGWQLFDCDPLTVSGGRYLSRGTVLAPDGAMLASFVQQGYIRPQR